MVAIEKTLKVIGTSPIRPDGIDKVTGRAEYGADVKLTGLLYGRVKRSPHAHAILKRIDASKALALPGVKAVVTRADFPVPGDVWLTMGEGAPVALKWLVDNICASDKVLYKGHAIAAVAATDPHIFEDALALIEVEYEVLPHVLDVRDAMMESAPLLHGDALKGGLRADEQGLRPSNIAIRIEHSQGDLEAGFAAADIVVEREFETAMAHQGYIEPHVTTAFCKGDEVTIWTSTQGAFAVRDQTARILQLTPSSIKVIPTEIGGGFGGKVPIYLDPMAVLLAKKTGQPVKLIMTREEVFEGTGPTSGTYSRVKVGAKRDGTITAVEAHLAYEAGAYPGSPIGHASLAIAGAYDIANVFIEGWDVVVNKPKVTAYRAPGAPASAIGLETIIDEIADQLGMDPMDLRLKNASKEGTRLPSGVVLGRVGNIEVMDAMQASAHYQSELDGPNRGRGVAVAYWMNAGLEASAYAALNADGNVALILGTTDIGGTRAGLAMQFAEALGIPVSDVHPTVVDTDSIGFTGPTVGSRTAFSGGWAVYEAAKDLQRQLEARAAKIWDADLDAVHYEDGVFFGPGGAQLTFKELAAKLPMTGGMLQGRADVNPQTVGVCFAGHIVDVEVDPDTGKVQILRYTAVQDVGRAVHRAYCEGQAQGGAAQGIGMALNEEYFFDANGVMRNSSLLDYRMPTALDLPMIDAILVEVPNPGHPYGVRGVGEVCIVPPLPAIANAIAHATGQRIFSFPASPRTILEALLPPEA